MLGHQESSEEVRVVYRNYATLYFVFVVDGSESELGILDLIQVCVSGYHLYVFITMNMIIFQVFVESLDRVFENVCELDLVFNFYKVRVAFLFRSSSSLTVELQVYAILDEIFLAGEIEETSKDVVLARLDELEKLE